MKFLTIAVIWPIIFFLSVCGGTYLNNLIIGEAITNQGINLFWWIVEFILLILSFPISAFVTTVAIAISVITKGESKD